MSEFTHASAKDEENSLKRPPHWEYGSRFDTETGDSYSTLSCLVCDHEVTPFKHRDLYWFGCACTIKYIGPYDVDNLSPVPND